MALILAVAAPSVANAVQTRRAARAAAARVATPNAHAVGPSGYDCRERGAPMDPITTAALAGLTLVAADAAKETTTKLATTAWGRIKSKLGWTSDPPKAEIEAKATAALENKPELAKEIDQIANDYRDQRESVHIESQGSMDLRGAKVGTIKQVNIGQNSGPVNL